MKNSLFALIALTAMTFTSCKKEGCTDKNATNYNGKAKKDNGSCTYATNPVEETGQVKIELEHQWVNSSTNFELNTAYTHPTTGDQMTFTTFKYYISNLKLKKQDGTWWTHPESYFLVDMNQPESSVLTLTGIPAGSYTEVSYVMGVDSTRNVSGSQTGALSTTNGMFWSWNSGYIMMKAEGTCPQSSSGSFTFHFGGFSGINNIVTTKSATFGSDVLNVTNSSNGMIHLGVDPSRLFTSSVSNVNSIHMPGANAKAMASGFYSSGVTFKFIHN